VRQFAKDEEPAAKEIMELGRLPAGEDLDGRELLEIVGRVGAVGPALVVAGQFRFDHPIADTFTDHTDQDRTPRPASE